MLTIKKAILCETKLNQLAYIFCKIGNIFVDINFNVYKDIKPIEEEINGKTYYRTMIFKKDGSRKFSKVLK